MMSASALLVCLFWTTLSSVASSPSNPTQTLSSVLLTHRPEQPWKFISDCIDEAIKAEAMPRKGKNLDMSFCDFLDAAVPLPPDEHTDGQPLSHPATVCAILHALLPAGQ